MRGGRLHILAQPRALLGGLADRFGAASESGLEACGVRCQVRPLWPEGWTRWFLLSRLPGRNFLYDSGPARWWEAKLLRTIKPNDVVWVHGASSVLPTRRNRLELAIRARGAHYLFHMEDDWLSVPSLQAATLTRIRLADGIGVVTKALELRVRSSFPEARVGYFEEPIDVGQFLGVEATSRVSPPVLVWTGRPRNTQHLLRLGPILVDLFRRHRFRLRIITGVKPTLDLGIPWEWVPYDPAQHARDLAGAAAGIAWFDDNAYNRCKGNYKIKTYLAAGIPPVTTPVGYNLELVKDGETGFLARTRAEWDHALDTLLQRNATVRRMGLAARADAVARFSHAALMPVWAAELRRLFPSLTQDGRSTARES